MGTTWINPSNVGANYNATSGLNSLFGGGGTGTDLGIVGLSGLAGAFPTNSSSSTTSALQTLQNLFGSSNTSTTGNANTSGTTSTGYGTAGTSAIAAANPVLSNLLQGTNLSTSYLPQQTAQIQQNNQAQQAQVNNEMASRGLSTSPVAAAAQANIAAQGSGQVTNLQQSIPLLQQQLQSSALNTTGSYLSHLPQTTSTTGTQATSGTTAGTTSQTNNTGQSGSSNTSGKAGGGLGGLFGGLASALASLFG